MTNSKDATLKSIENLLTVKNALVTHPDGLTLADLQTVTGMSETTVRKYLGRLAKDDAVEKIWRMKR